MHWTSGRAYGQDLRDRVIAAVDGGETVRLVAERFGVSVSYIDKVLIRRRQTGKVCARPGRGRPPRKLAAHEDAVAAFMSDNADATLKGTRLVDAVPPAPPVPPVPHAHWRTATFPCGLTTNGLVAPLVLSGPMTRAAFLADVEQFLMPALCPGQVVVMDNLAAHKVAGVRDILQRTGIGVMYLPPNSLDLNPIEQAFAKLKTLLRKARARTRDDLWSTIGRLMDRFDPVECRGYVSNAG